LIAYDKEEEEEEGYGRISMWVGGGVKKKKKTSFV
jgi:hypothetical protein